MDAARMMYNQQQQQQQPQQQQDYIINQRYKLGKKIGYGSFGDIFVGIDLGTNEEVAIKVECAKTKHPQLHTESVLLDQLQNGSGIPRVRWSGKHGDYNIMIMDLLGPNLEELFCLCHRRFSMRTITMLADQMLSRIQFIHQEGYIHRDIKPDNFLMGLGQNSNMVFLIDFGLARVYRDPKTGQHIQYRENKTLTGTARYASVSTHQGIEQSRRDDLEALGYVLMYFNRGSLPWQGLRGATKRQKYEKICEKKMATSVDELCKGYPKEFAMYLNYCRGLEFDEDPNYKHLKELFRKLSSVHASYSFSFDWAELGARQAI